MLNGGTLSSLFSGAFRHFGGSRVKKGTVSVHLPVFSEEDRLVLAILRKAEWKPIQAAPQLFTRSIWGTEIKRPIRHYSAHFDSDEVIPIVDFLSRISHGHYGSCDFDFGVVRATFNRLNIEANEIVLSPDAFRLLRVPSRAIRSVEDCRRHHFPKRRCEIVSITLHND
jgi:hypothetical protein